MVSAGKKVLIIGIVIIVVFFVPNAILSSSFGITLAAGIPYILIAGILLIISSFLPKTFAAVCRNITYLILFVFILVVEMQLLGVIIDTLGVTSFPQDQSILGWFTFLLFYIILPFVFIFVLIRNLMGDVFRGIFDRRILKVLSFVIAIYATFVIPMFGGFLLQFLGYSTWGLAGIFGAIFIVRSLRKLIEGWFKIETYAEEIKKYYELQKTEKQKYAELALKKVKELKNYVSTVRPTDDKTKKIIDNAIESSANSLKNIDFFNALTDDEQGVITTAINQINIFARAGEYEEVKKVLDQLERVLKMWKK